MQPFELQQRNLDTRYTQNLNFQNYLSLLVTPEDAQTNNPKTNQQSTLTSNILPATITENKLLDAIFPFELEEPSTTPLFSRATFEEKSIITIYTDAKVDGYLIKLILDSGLASSIITRQLMNQLGCQVDQTASARIITANKVTKTPISEINNLPIEINGIIIPIKVIVMKAIQYQVLVDAVWRQAIKHLDKCPHDDDKIWQMALAKIKEVSPEEIKRIKNNPPEPIELNWDPEPVINLLDPEQFHEHYQKLALTRKEQEQCSSSSAQIGDKNDNDLNSNSNPKTYIVFPDFSKKQELKWFNNNNENIMPECAHNTDARFNLRYSEKDTIKLEPHSCTCIDLKIALKIPATTIVQLAFRSSLAKKGINIRRGIINAGYVGNIIAILQNNLEKTYVIEPNEKITQTIFLPLVKVAQLVLVENKEELEITAREIQGFRSTVTIERKVKDQIQIFEAEAQLCESGKIGLINLYISAKNYGYIKISIYNNTGNIMEIPKETIIGYLTTKIEKQPPNLIPDFSQLCKYMRRILYAPTRTIGTDELEKLRPTTTNTT
ncbi:hypothetical protein G9A89_013149 [Geosiphon pyriformis]|nr:hypothetical protein G9A89_013149 [Geosiphon pyriformis]